MVTDNCDRYLRKGMETDREVKEGNNNNNNKKRMAAVIACPELEYAEQTLVFFYGCPPLEHPSPSATVGGAFTDARAYRKFHHTVKTVLRSLAICGRWSYGILALKCARAVLLPSSR